jgi:hypothetical protein
MIALVILDYCALSLPRAVHATSQEALRFGYFLECGKRRGARRAAEPPPWMAAIDPEIRDRGSRITRTSNWWLLKFGSREGRKS